MAKFNLFQPIDASQEGWEDELRNREAMSAKINFMNQLSQSNPDNKTLQNALLEQYFGMLFPEEEDQGQYADYAMGLLGSGDEEMANYGRSILESINQGIGSKLGISFGDETITPQTEMQNTFADKFAQEFALQDAEGEYLGEEQLAKNKSMLDKLTQNPQLAEQYYSMEDPTLGENWQRMMESRQGKNPFSIGIGGSLNELATVLGMNNKDYKLKKSGLLSDYQL